MKIIKYVFKDLSLEDEQTLLKTMANLGIPHDIDIYERSDEEWDDHTKSLYKAYRKALDAFKTRLFKLKHNIK